MKIKSQALSIDFLIGFFVLLLVFTLFFSFWYLYESKRQSSFENNELIDFAEKSLTFLISSPGSPGNWTENITTIKSLGISDGAGGVSYNKLRAFIDNSQEMYDEFTIFLGISPNDFLFNLYYYNGTQYELIDSAGKTPSENSVIFVSMRDTLVNGSLGRAEMFIWREK
jgi:hypothetical protein